MKHDVTVEDLQLQREWSEKTFGPGLRTLGVTNHIRKELSEIEDDPTDLNEWIDVVILGFDGAWRSGHKPEEIMEALHAKWEKNRLRKWPDWRLAPEDTPIEHVKGHHD